jgi:hypothetical protein
MSTERRVRLFRNGRNRALRIPRDLELPGRTATLRKLCLGGGSGRFDCKSDRRGDRGQGHGAAPIERSQVSNRQTGHALSVSLKGFGS